MQSPATRDLITERPARSTANMKSGLELCLRAPNTQCLLDEALLATNAITRDDYRDWALREVIRTQARAADLPEVRASIRRLSDIRLILVSLREAVIGLVAAGRLTDAKTLAATIPDQWNRARALAAVVAAEVKTGSPNSSLPTLLALLPQIEDKVGAAEIAGDLAAQLAAHGAMEAATRTLETVLSILIEDTDAYPIALGIIAGAHARMGQTEMALKLLAEIGELGRDHIALAETAGQFAKRRLSRDAISIAERLRAPQLYVLALSKIASAQTDIGEHAAAKRTLARAMTASLDIERPFAVDMAMARIATVWSEVPNYRRAFVTVEKIKNRTLRARTIWKFAASGNGDASRIGAQALRATEAIESPFDRAAVLTRAAILMARNNRLDDARRIFALALKEARVVRTNWWRARIFSRLATALLTFAP
jgi:tetratricopeptide (TPR) repeat protein